MTIKLLLLISTTLLLLVTGCAHYQPDPWRGEDTAMLIGASVPLAIDWLQTKEITRNPEMTETNPILGEDPSQGAIDGYFVASWAGIAGIAYLLPEDMRAIWLGGVFMVEVFCVGHNVSAGVTIKF